MTDAWPGEDDPRATLSLWDYRRRVTELYAAVRRLPPHEGWDRWRSERDALFGEHPQSPIPPDRRPGFAGLPVFAYDPSLRVTAVIEPTAERRIGLVHSGAGATPARSFAVARFRLADTDHRLTLWWLEEYGGGVFLPFRDTTNGTTTYGGGRYLLDTAKGADLGHAVDGIVLDFNFAYHPSCAHDDRWSCPLAPPENRLTVPITGGERLPHR
jgi:uncharacterized protein (DUF1684 family)